ncbi:MAG: PAS domain-containing protein [Reyranellaceae bacterium]
MTVPNPTVARAPSPALEVSSSILLAVALGLLGFLVNQVEIPLGWGVHILVGNALALVSLRILPPALATTAVAIASLQTVLLWHHPWAWGIWILEGLLLSVTVRRASPILADLAFWIVIGGPLLYATYGVIMGMDGVPLGLVVAKQALNGVLNVVLAEIAYVALLLLPRRGVLARLTPMPARSFGIMLVSALVVLPMPAFLWLNAKDQEERILVAERAALSGDGERAEYYVQSWMQSRRVALEALARAAGARPVVRLDPAELGSLAQDFDEIALFDPNGRSLGHYGRSPFAANCFAAWTETVGKADPSGVVSEVHRANPAEPPHIEIRLRVAAGSGTVIVCAAFAPGSIHPMLDGLAAEESAVLVDSRGEKAAGANLEAVPARLLGDAIKAWSIRKRSDVLLLTPSGFGVSLMTNLQNSYLVGLQPFLQPTGWGLVLLRPLGPQIAAVRALQLHLMVAQASFIVLALLGAWLASRFLESIFEALGSGAERILAAHRPESSIGSRVIVEVDRADRRVRALGEALTSTRSEAQALADRLRLLSSHAPIGVYSVFVEHGLHSAFESISESLERMLGYTREEVERPGWWSRVIHPDEAAEVLAHYRNILPGQVITTEYRLARKSGEYLWVYDTLATHDVPEPDGRLIAVGLLIDITARKEAQLQLAQASKLASLGEMATGIAHEINQPLNVIAMVAQLARAEIRDQRAGDANALGALAESLEGSVARIETQAERAAQIVRNMRIFGRTQSLVAQPFDGRDAIRLAVDLVAEQLRRGGIELSLEIADGPLPAHGFETMVAQVLVNLLINAHDALLSPGGWPRRVRLVAGRDEAAGTVVVRICDSGPGVPAALAGRIFEPFFSTKPVGQGAGLGLAISYGIMKEMGGDLRLEPSAAGAVFRVEIPGAGTKAVRAATPSGGGDATLQDRGAG